MKYRTMQSTGDSLSVLGFGCMRFPQKNGRIDEAPSTRMLLRSAEAGINYFDTALPYHRGASEAFLGRVLAEHSLRDNVNIATKLPHWLAESRQDMDRLLASQLNNLQTDRIDYYLIHNLNGESWRRAAALGVTDFLDAALRDGKILHAGFSFHGRLDDFEDIIAAYDWQFTQIQYNILDQEFQAGTAGLEYAAARGLGVIVMEPLRGGSLTGPVPPEVQRIWDKGGFTSPADLQLRWIWDRPEVQVVLSGMSSGRQLEENLASADRSGAGTMSRDERDLIDQAAGTYRRLMRAGCTGCGYCQPCPEGVEIPVCLDVLNNRYMFNKKKASRQRYAFLLGGMASGRTGLASQCTGCGQCLDKCPQQLPIPDLIREAERELETVLTKPLIWAGRLMASLQRRRALRQAGRTG